MGRYATLLDDIVVDSNQRAETQDGMTTVLARHSEEHVLLQVVEWQPGPNSIIDWENVDKSTSESEKLTVEASWEGATICKQRSKE